MKSWELWLEYLKSKINIIQRLINTTSTPDAFIVNKSESPAIANINRFLAKYNLNKISNLQLYDEQAKYYERNGYVASIVEYSKFTPDEVVAILLDGLQHKKSTISFLSCIYNQKQRNFVTVQEQLPKKNKNKKQVVVNKLLDKQRELISYGAEVVLPLETINIIREYFYGLSTVEVYSTDTFINEQLIKADEPFYSKITDDLVLQINDHYYMTLFTKEYPENTVQLLQNLFNVLCDSDINLFYNINCNDLENNKVKFINTFIVFDSSREKLLEKTKLLIDYMYSNFGWLLAKNKGFSFQQFMSCIPMQFDDDIAKFQDNYTIKHTFPTELLKDFIYHEIQTTT